MLVNANPKTVEEIEAWLEANGWIKDPFFVATRLRRAVSDVCYLHTKSEPIRLVVWKQWGCGIFNLKGGDMMLQKFKRNAQLEKLKNFLTQYEN